MKRFIRVYINKDWFKDKVYLKIDILYGQRLMIYQNLKLAVVKVLNIPINIFKKSLSNVLYHAFSLNIYEYLEYHQHQYLEYLEYL